VVHFLTKENFPELPDWIRASQIGAHPIKTIYRFFPKPVAQLVLKNATNININSF
jgi:hypothetical protein